MHGWTSASLLRFHPEKCCTMRVRIGSSSVNKREYTLGLDKAVIGRVSEEKDIRIIVDDKMSFSKHIATKNKKANSIMGVIRRTYLDDDSFLLLYKALVRPHLEYANQFGPPPEERYHCIRECAIACHEKAPRNKGPKLQTTTQEVEATTLHYCRL